MFLEGLSLYLIAIQSEGLISCLRKINRSQYIEYIYFIYSYEATSVNQEAGVSTQVPEHLSYGCSLITADKKLLHLLIGNTNGESTIQYCRICVKLMFHSIDA